MSESAQYHYDDAKPTWATSYLWPFLLQQIDDLGLGGSPRRGLDVGCGNGATCGMLARRGFAMTGIDTSESGIELAERAFPECRFAVVSVYEDLSTRFGPFPLIVSLEVVEHLFDPRKFARNLYAAVEPGGVVIISTPYHGYIKNVALAVSGKLDRHFTALWDGGHIKFFSIATLEALLLEAGFEKPRIARVGRIPPLAKSMVAVARKPQ